MVDIGDEDDDLVNYVDEELPPPQMVDVENNGQSRLCCFRCGYEMCDKCAIFLDNLELKKTQLKNSQKFRVIAEKVRFRENGVFANTIGAKPEESTKSFKNDKKSTASSATGRAWIMDGVQLKTISKTVQVQGLIQNGSAVTPKQY